MSKLNNVAENFGLRFHTNVTIRKLNKNRLNDLTEEEINKADIPVKSLDFYLADMLFQKGL